MPQFDVFVFGSSIFYLLIFFFSLLLYNQFIFLPQLASMLKMRHKLSTREPIVVKTKKLSYYKLAETLC